MNIRIPSFRSQIFLVVIFLVFNSVFFFRNYFLDSFEDFTDTVESIDTEKELNMLYQNYSKYLDLDNRQDFKIEIESMLTLEIQKSLARNLFQKEIALYSKFIFVFLSMSVLILFFFSFSLITRPLQRLQTATNQLSGGNWEIEVKESKFSPLNGLIISFNTMIRELELNRTRLIQAEKESAWRDLARIMAHEIKNPLTPMRLSLERLEQKYLNKAPDLDIVFKNVAAVIHEEINNLQKFSTEFSQFAKLPSATFVNFDLNVELNNIIEPYKNRIKFDFMENQEVLPIDADKNQLKQIFTNLIQNSLLSKESDCRINLSTSLEKTGIRVIVEDNGPGIPLEEQEKIFEPYFTKRNKGTGLGLSIVKRIVENHGGSIILDPKNNKGAKFILEFPLKK